MTQSEGLKLLSGRLGFTGGRLRRLVRDRYPLGCPKEEKRGLRSCCVKCFLRSDIMFTDVLHAGYDELKYLGIGRRYLTNKILRSIVAGECDAQDWTRVAGDFQPRSWMSPRKAERMREVQERCLYLVKNVNAKLLQSVKVRLRNASTHILLEISENCDRIRSMVREAALVKEGSGLRRFSRFLVEYRNRFNLETRKIDIRNRKIAKKKRKFHRTSSKPYGTVGRRMAHLGFSVLTRGLTDLRKLVDPNMPNWFRRPTDSDWSEGMGPNGRKPRTFNRKTTFVRHGLGDIPGVTTPVSSDEWFDLRTDWKMAEVKKG